MLDPAKILQGLNDELEAAERRVIHIQVIRNTASRLLKLEGWNEVQEAEWESLCKAAKEIGYPRLERHKD